MTKEIPMKQWRLETAARDHVHKTTVAERLARGFYKPELRRVNKRVVFVVVHFDDASNR